jgi:hypothetical protein
MRISAPKFSVRFFCQCQDEWLRGSKAHAYAARRGVAGQTPIEATRYIRLGVAEIGDRPASTTLGCRLEIGR